MVSVIVPNYNHVAFLEQRIQSILAQTISDLELILLDDASTDGSVEILRRYASHPRVAHLVINERNGGSAFKQWSKGCALARGEWVWFAESDDACTPDLLAELLALNERAEDSLGMVFAQSGFINEQGERFASMLRHTTVCFNPDPFARDMVMDGPSFVRRFLKVKNIIPNASAVIVRRSLIMDDAMWAGLSEMKLCGDWLLWVRLLQRSSIGFVSKELNWFRHHQATTRELTTTPQRKRRALEEAAVRSALASFEGVDQSTEEEALYDGWFGYFTWKRMFSHELFSIRINSRSRTEFLFRFLSFKWGAFKSRVDALVGSR